MIHRLPYKKGDLLYHSSHGPCRIKDILKETQSGKSRYCYELESRQAHLGRSRFLVDTDQVETSGFHPAISRKEANRILNYLKTNDPKDRSLGMKQAQVVLGLIEENTPWAFARAILILARETNGKGAKGKREMLGRAAKGLAFELAFAFAIPNEEGVLLMKKSLKQKAKTNPWALETISNIL